MWLTDTHLLKIISYNNIILHLLNTLIEMTANTVNTTFVVKITHANELRRGVCPTVSYAALCELVSKLFAFENYVSLVLKYKDDEGDLITLVCDGLFLACLL